MALYLGIDTATPFLSLALWSSQEGERAVVSERVERAHAERIIPALEALFANANAHPKELSGIGVGIGPGSYTGLRVGLATAKGLAQGLEVPLKGGSTLAAMAWSALHKDETGIAALDARRGKVYAGIFKREGDNLVTLEPVGKHLRDELRRTHPKLTWLEDRAPDPLYIARAVAEPHGVEARALYL